MIGKIDNGSDNPEYWSRSLLLVAYREKEKELAELKEANQNLIKALTDIQKHLKLICPTGFQMSGVYAIATKCLKGGKGNEM